MAVRARGLHNGREWFERFARIGYGAKGVVYALVGFLALKVAIGQGGKTTGSKGALTELSRQPFGAVMLAAIAVGLVAYVLWRFVQAFADAEHKGKDAKGIGHRIAYFVSGIVYAGLAVSAAGLIMGKGGGGDDDARGMTAKLLSAPFGQVLVGVVAVLILGGAISDFVKAYKKSFCKNLDLGSLEPDKRKLAVRASRLGIAARGGVFALISVFLGRAAITANPGEAKGLGEALAALAQQPRGAVLLGIAALGLLCYALYLFIVARYRRIPVPVGMGKDTLAQAKRVVSR